MPTLANPWVILGAVGAFLAAALGGYFYGAHVEGLAWTAKVEQQKQQAAQILADATARVLDLERKNTDLNNELEQSHADALASTAQADSRVRDALADFRLRQQSRCGPSRNVTPGQTIAAGDAADAATGGDGGLSAKIDDDHRDCARSANILAAYARECHAYALRLSQ